jgi:hypothetical protein
MNRFLIRLLAVCFFLIIVCPIIGAAADNNTTTATSSVVNVVEIRGPVYNGSTLTDILANPAYGDGTTITMDATQFAAFSYDIDQNVTNNTIKKGTFTFNVTGVGKGTGEGTFNKTTGVFTFGGTSTAKGDFTGTYNTNTKEGTITYNTNPSEATSNFTATYDTITNELAINIADPNQLMYYPDVESDLSEGSLVNNTVTEEIEENIAQEEPYSIVNVNATLDGLIQQA